MHNVTRLKFNAYKERQQEINNVSQVEAPFNVAPSVAQKLEKRVQESADFLTKINIVPVDEVKGETLGLGAGSTIAGTTDTTNKDRETSDPTELMANSYECTQTNFDTHVRYSKLDMWAKFPNFQSQLRDVATEQQARDLIMIGFNGTSRAATSDRANNPLLQDVNKGWLQKVRENKPENVMKDIIIGIDGDYKNLDAAVLDATNELIAEWFQDDPDLVVIIGRQLLGDKYLTLVNDNDLPTEKAALRSLMANKTIGNLPAIRVPFFPANALMITRLDNLSIYNQTGSRRRAIIDNPKRDCIEDFQSVNQSYVVENYDCVALIENIQMQTEEVTEPDAGGGE